MNMEKEKKQKTDDKNLSRLIVKLNGKNKVLKALKKKLAEEKVPENHPGEDGQHQVIRQDSSD